LHNRQQGITAQSDFREELKANINGGHQRTWRNFSFIQTNI